MNFFLFELKYRSNRVATYAYFLILFLISFMFVATDVVQLGGADGNVMENSPFVIMQMMAVLSLFGLLMISGVMGVPVFRDFDHNTYSLFYTKPISKYAYLGGRFFGSLLVMLFIFSGIPLGMIAGSLSPWAEADKLLPFNLWHYIYNFLIILVPVTFFAGAIFFTVGALSRKQMFVYTQGILMFGLYLIASIFTDKFDSEWLANLIDPTGLGAIDVTTRYWTVDDKNTMLMPFNKAFLINRLVWFAIGCLTLAFCFWRFKLSAYQDGRRGKKSKTLIAPTAVGHKAFLRLNLPKVSRHFDFSTQWKQLWMFTKFYFKSIIKDIPFISISLFGLLLMGINSVYVGEMYGTNVYPVTRMMTEFISSQFMVFILIIITFYAGELVWRERQLKVDQIYDTMPVPDFVNLTSKFLALILVMVFICAALILFSIIVQVFYGYFNFELGLYVSYYIRQLLPFLILLSILALFIQVMVNNKFLGYFLTILFMIVNWFVLGTLDLDHNLYQYGGMPSGTYSDMNRFGHFTLPRLWFSVYWFGLAALLFALAVLFSVRGKETLFKMRSRIARYNLGPAMMSMGTVSLLTFLLAGGYVFYNTNILNKYESPKKQKQLQADYEKKYKKFENILQPKIVATNVKVDFYPQKRDFTAEGYYNIANKGNVAIDSIHIQTSDDDVEHDIRFEGGGAEVVWDDKDIGYKIYRLKNPLQPKEVRKMNFKTIYTTDGFKNSGSNTNIVYNGTFINNTYFPAFGYHARYELGKDDDRKDYGLEKKNDRMPPRTDTLETAKHFISDDADMMDFEIVLGTDKDQIAVAPGYLQKEWEENGRKYYHYKMDKPICNFYAMVSARYEVKKDVWKPPVDTLDDVEVAVYYHHAHPYNVDRMIDGVKKSLDYYTENFNPYQYRQMRILEFPAYASFAQSFANTVPFSEGIGFIARIRNPEQDIDYPFYVTAHEVAHQWWGHQVAEAPVQGNAMLSETMSQYSALMVMKKEYGREQMKRFLKYELDRYLRGRGFEQKKEMALMDVEGQGYIHYRKGSLVMYALQDYIGEDKVNEALARFCDDWNVMNCPPYPTSEDLLGYFKEVTPDSLQYLITDMFETITLFENRVEEAGYKKMDNGKYEVTLKVHSKKFRADSLGKQQTIALQDWIDIGIFAKDDKESKSTKHPLYLKKHKITKEDNVFTILIDKEPETAGIDPYNKLVDRHTQDNLEKLVKKD